MTSQSVLGKSFTLSLLLHAGLVGLLVLMAARPPDLSDTVLRVRILEQPVPRPAPEVASPPPPERLLGEPRPRGKRSAMVEASRESSAQRVPEGREGLTGSGDRPAGATGGIGVPDLREQPATSPARLAGRPAPEVAVPPQEKRGEPPPDTPPPALPERSGLSLGGPPPGGPPSSRLSAAPPASGPPRLSLREQIARLGSGIEGNAGGSAKQTINLDNREDRFAGYLARVKWRIQNVWVYPEEARSLGLTGELLLVFTLNKGGTLTDLRLLQSSGFPILDEEALRAVRLAAPYDPFPPQMGEEPWNISASFHYNLPYRFRRN